MLYLGRLHAKKGLDQLLHAWATVERAHAGPRLRIIGPSEGGYDDALRRLIVSLDLRRVAIEPPLFEPAAKLAAYRSADVVVLPTRNENFGMTIAEALAAEIPVISTKGAPWSGVRANRCGWWIDFGAEPLAATLLSALAVPTGELSEMGRRGRAWMARDFGWTRIAAEMAELYAWLLRGGEPPASVRLA